VSIGSRGTAADGWKRERLGAFNQQSKSQMQFSAPLMHKNIFRIHILWKCIYMRRLSVCVLRAARRVPFSPLFLHFVTHNPTFFLLFGCDTWDLTRPKITFYVRWCGVSTVKFTRSRRGILYHTHIFLLYKINFCVKGAGGWCEISLTRNKNY